MKKLICLFSLLFSSALLAAAEKLPLKLDHCFIQAPIAGSQVSAAFFTLDNPSAESVQLIAAQIPALSDNVQLHAMTMQNGTMHMQQITHYEVSMGKHAFKKGGYHLMLTDLKTAPIIGKTYPLTLVFTGGKKLTCAAKVLSAPQIIEHFKAEPNHQHHHH